jgi:hypothetical protein
VERRRRPHVRHSQALDVASPSRARARRAATSPTSLRLYVFIVSEAAAAPSSLAHRHAWRLVWRCWRPLGRPRAACGSHAGRRGGSAAASRGRDLALPFGPAA